MPLADGDQERVVLAVEPGIGGQVRFEEGPDGLVGGAGRDHAMTRQHASYSFSSVLLPLQPSD